MTDKIIGILGGMGPEATLDCFAKIIKNTPALRVIINSNPRVPDRTPAIIGDGESPVPAIIEGCRVLERAGADFIIIPCVSAHFFLDDIRLQTRMPILSIFDAVAEVVSTHRPALKTVGLLATTGTVQGGLFQKRLFEDGIETILPSDAVQAKIMEAIYAIKANGSSRRRPETTASLVAAAESLLSRKPAGAQAVVAGCTEIPLALQQHHLRVPYFDALEILARKAIEYAGMPE